MRAALRRYHDDRQQFWNIHPTQISRFPLDFAHLRCKEIELLFPELVQTIASYRSVILVRNPYRRFVSAVAHYFCVCWPAIPMIKLHHSEQRWLAQNLVQHLSDNPAIVTADFRLVHFSPQAWFIRSDTRQFANNIIALDGVDRAHSFSEQAFQCLGLSPRPLVSRNVSRVDLGHLLDNPRIAAFVRIFYQEDFEFFVKYPALRHLVAEPL